MDPARDGAREADNVGGQRRIILRVIGCVVADDVDDGRRGAARIVEIGQTIGQARPQMEQRRRRFLGHAAIAVGHAGDGSLEETKDRTHALDLVERGHEMHFRGARIGETDLHARVHQRPYQTFRAVH